MPTYLINNLNTFFVNFVEKFKANDKENIIDKWLSKDNQEKLHSFFYPKLEDSNIKDTNEVQKHGFIIEDFIIKNIYKCDINIKYNSIYDLPGYLNNINKEVNISIKTANNINRICFADVCRFYETINTNKPIHILIICYEQKKTIKKIKGIYEIDLTNTLDIFFNNLSFEKLKEYNNEIKNIPKGVKLTDEEKNKYYKNKQKELQKQCGLITINPKVDSKTQRRLQCSLTKFNLFIKQYPEKLLYYNDSNIYQNIEIPDVKTEKRNKKRNK